MSTNAAKPVQPSSLGLAAEVDQLLRSLDVEERRYKGGSLAARSPINGDVIAHVQETAIADAEKEIEKAHDAFLDWRLVPAPKRGELVRLFGEELRTHKHALGRLVSIEAGKIISE